MKVFRRDCRRKTSECEVLYTGKEDGIHQWFKEICAGDEIGWDFVDSVINSKMSFTAFVSRMTRSYVTIYEKSPSFMSVNTFVSWFFYVINRRCGRTHPREQLLLQYYKA